MQHRIDLDTAGPHAEPMARAVESCVHCGFCLPTCPTYRVMGEEAHSPRGRIVLMKEVLEGGITADEAAPYLDPCLGCLACVSACPSGVPYGDLLTPYRMRTEAVRARGPLERLQRALVLETIPYPRRFRIAALLGRFARPLAGLLPRRLGAMLELIPLRLPRARPLPEVTPAQGPRRARVALLAGCAQRVLEPDINAATLRVLAANGVETVVPRAQGCCGAIAAHTGDGRRARALARDLLRSLPDDVDAVVTNAAGCGSGLHEFPLWLRGEPEEEAAHDLAGRAVDVSDFLVRLGPRPPKCLHKPLRVVYHDACHLRHAQGVTRAPRELLSMIEQIELLELTDPEICCGSAGSYNLEQPATAAELGRRKAQAVLDSGAQAVASGNIGCIAQLRTHLHALGADISVEHTVQLLDRAYRGA